MKKIELSVDNGSIIMNFVFDYRILNDIKNIKGRKWNPANKNWSTSIINFGDVLDKLSNYKLVNLDEVQLIYNEMVEHPTNPFQKEINYVKDKKLLKDILKLAPIYFWTIPASSTGAYHPSYVQGDGGLVRHTQAMCEIAYLMFDNECICPKKDFTKAIKDSIIIAIVAHDMFKLGNNGKFTDDEHPNISADKIEKNIQDKDVKLICDMIRSHMGPWNTIHESEKTLPLPDNKYRLFLHMMDYLSSKKIIEIDLSGRELILK